MDQKSELRRLDDQGLLDDVHTAGVSFDPYMLIETTYKRLYPSLYRTTPGLQMISRPQTSQRMTGKSNSTRASGSPHRQRPITAPTVPKLKISAPQAEDERKRSKSAKSHLQQSPKKLDSKSAASQEQSSRQSATKLFTNPQSSKDDPDSPVPSDSESEEENEETAKPECVNEVELKPDGILIRTTSTHRFHQDQLLIPQYYIHDALRVNYKPPSPTTPSSLKLPMSTILSKKNHSDVGGGSRRGCQQQFRPWTENFSEKGLMRGKEIVEQSNFTDLHPLFTRLSRSRQCSVTPLKSATTPASRRHHSSGSRGSARSSSSSQING